MVWCISVAKDKDAYMVLWSLPSEGSIHSLIEEDATSWWSFMRPDFIPSGDEHPVESNSFIRRSFHILAQSILYWIAHRRRDIFGVYNFEWRLSKTLHCFCYAKSLSLFLAYFLIIFCLRKPNFFFQKNSCWHCVSSGTEFRIHALRSYIWGRIISRVISHGNRELFWNHFSFGLWNVYQISLN